MKKEQIKSLNETFPEFYLEELEQRLETDPLNVGALVSLETEEQISTQGWCIINICSENNGL